MNTTALSIDTVSAIAQLSLLGYEEGDSVCIRAFTPKVKGQEGKAQNLTCKFPDLPWKRLEALQKEGYGIYFVVNGQGHRDGEITRARAFFFEWDDLAISEQLEKWKELGLPEPTMQIVTRKSVHNYYAIAGGCEIEDWKELQSNLLRFTASDLKLKNPSRVMRLAGCWHIKPGEDPIQCELVQTSDTRLSVETARLIIPAPAPALEEAEAPRAEPNLNRVNGSLGATSIADFLENDVYPRLSVKQTYNWGGHQWQETRSGKMRGDCPFHESSTGTAFWVERSQDGKTYSWACPTCTDNHKSNAIAYRHRMKGGNGSPKGKEFIEIVKELADQAGVALPEIKKPESTAEEIAQAPVPVKEEALKLGFHEILDRVDVIERTTIDESELIWNLQNFAHDAGLAKRGFNGKTLLQMARSRRDAGDKLEVFDAHEILNLEQNPKFLIAGHLLEGTVTVLAAQGGLGKTTLLYDFAKHIALGKPWCNYRVRQGRSLIVQTDEPKPNIKQKLRIAHFGDVPKGSIDFITQFRFTKFRQLAELIRKNKYAFVVIDSWTAAHAGTGVDLTKSNAGDNAYLLRDLAEETGAAIVIVHHVNKMGDLRDSSALADNVSEVWRMSKGTSEDALEKGQRLLMIDKSRSDLQGHYLLQQNPVDYSWEHLGVKEAPDVKGGLPLISEIFDKMCDHPKKRFTAADVVKQFGVDFQKAQIELERLQRQGAIDSEWVVHNGTGFWSYIYREDYSDEVESGQTTVEESVKQINEEEIATVEEAISQLQIVVTMKDPELKRLAIAYMGGLSRAEKEAVWGGLSKAERIAFKEIPISEPSEVQAV